ncbi:hypothetical protein GCM10022254_34290 [Actinomadura meridiana]|uniref:DHHA1 domain-containing protein n=1 Tax=Actinomadura meridiana TaxID=559626 RepID=A0ABP8C3I2_9ACTN
MALVERLREAERANGRLLDQVAAPATDAGGGRFACAHTDAPPRRLAKLVIDRLPGRRPGVMAVTSPSGFVVAANRAAQDLGLSAGELIKQVLAGRGGGTARLAQGRLSDDPPAALTVLARLLADTAVDR